MSEIETATRKIYQPADIGEYLIVADIGSHWIDFKCYQCSAMYADESGRYTVPQYRVKGDESGCELTGETDNAEVAIDAFIKWDGCSNMKLFPDDTYSYIHFCGRSNAAKFGQLIDHLYQLTNELLPTYGGDD